MGRRAELVGRKHELATLEAALDAGRGGLFLLGGEPGIGKTRLADELSERARLRGANVVWGSAWDGGGAPAYWPWIQILRALRTLAPAPDEHLRRDLGPLWDAQPEEPAGGDPDLLRFRRFDALRALLAAAAAGAPLLVVLDDLHAADAGTLLALQLVATALRGQAILFIGTLREGEGENDAGLARLARLGTVLHLARLGRDDVARMMGGADVAADLVDAVYATSAGNPLFVGETLRLVESGGRPDRAPAGVRAVIRERLARLGAPARRVLEAAAVLGQEFAPDALAHLTGLAAAEIATRLEAARAAGLVEERPDETLRFGHALFRTILDEDLDAERRAELHLRAADLPGDDEAIAGHLLAAPGADPARLVAAVTRAAAQTARAQAFDRAALLLEGALARLGPEAPGRLDLELTLAEALVRTGAGERARRLALDAAGRARAAGDAAGLVRAALAYGAELRPSIVDPVLVGLLDEARGALAASSSPDSSRGLRARVLARLAAARQPAADPRGPIADAAEAIAQARALGDEETLAAVLFAAGSAQATFAPPAVRAPISRELAALALRRGDLLLAQHGYTRLAIDCADLADLAGLELALRAQERLGAALGHPRWRWRGALLRSMLALARGEWDEAARAQTEATSLITDLDDPAAARVLLAHSFGAFRARGAGGVEEIVGLVSGASPPQADEVVIAGLAQASILARIGDRAGARHLLDSLPPWPPRLHLSPSAPALLADLAARLGDRARAAEALGDLARLDMPAVSWGIFGFIWDGPVARWTGVALAVLERWDEALAALEDARAAAEAAGARPIAVEILQALAGVHIGRGDVARARPLLERAAAEAEALDLRHLRREIAESLARLPRAPAEPPAPRFTIVREGDVWSVTSGGRVARLRHTRGLEMLAELIAEPGREFHVLDLGREGDGPVDAGDSGPLLDAAAKQAYRRRIAELEEELAQAETWNDQGRQGRARAELELLRDEIGRGVGLGGRDRRAGGAVERARINVQKRLRTAVKKIGESLPDLARHLEIHVKTGVYVTYRPEAPPE